MFRLALLASFVCACALAYEMVITPFGPMPSICVHEAKEGEVVTPVAGGVELRDAHTGELKKFFERLQICDDVAAQIKAEHIARRNHSSNGLRYDGWLDNVGYVTPSNVGYFYSMYTVCYANPTSKGQILYYFVGTENIDNGELSILQPVLSWYFDQWTFSSWNCCPSGQTWQGSTIYGLSPGATYSGDITVSGGTCTVGSYANGQSSILKVSQNNRRFDWVDATLEVYYLNQCSQFAAGAFTYSNYVIRDINGYTITPSWSAPTYTMCGGTMSVAPSKITITHTTY